MRGMIVKMAIRMEERKIRRRDEECRGAGRFGYKVGPLRETLWVLREDGSKQALGTRTRTRTK